MSLLTSMDSCDAARAIETFVSPDLKHASPVQLARGFSFLLAHAPLLDVTFSEKRIKLWTGMLKRLEDIKLCSSSPNVPVLPAIQAKMELARTIAELRGDDGSVS